MIKLLITALVLLLAYAAWRRWQRASRERYIERYPYRQQLDSRLAARRPELSAEQRRQVLAALSDYFVLCNRAGPRMLAMPSQAVDDAWHEFILSTRQYERFCRQAFGRFLHHTPAEAMETPLLASDGIKRTWRLACAHEGLNPVNPTHLPGLFAIDATLGLCGGFVYQLDCLAAQAAHGGSSCCASHIGCASGCSGDTGGGDGDAADGGSGCGGD